MIDAVNSGQSFTASAASAQKPGAVMQQVLTSAASEFGMSTSDLATALQAGQSLSDIAQQKGVSQSDLLATVTQALNTASANGATLPGDTSTTAQQIVYHKGLGGHHHRHHHSQGSESSTSSTANAADNMLQSLAGALNMQPTDLLQSLVSGTSLQSLAQQQGVSEQTLSSLVSTQGLAVDTTA